MLAGLGASSAGGGAQKPPAVAGGGAGNKGILVLDDARDLNGGSSAVENTSSGNHALIDPSEQIARSLPYNELCNMLTQVGYPNNGTEKGLGQSQTKC